MVQAVAPVQECMANPIQVVIHTQEEEHQGPMGQEEEPQEEEHLPQEEAMPAAARLHGRRSSQEEQVVQAVHHESLQGLRQSRHADPKLSLPSNYRSCSLLDMQQILESWSDKSTFAIAILARRCSKILAYSSSRPCKIQA